ncbi:unnamed protein product [Phyllotreta striolata]|uniref:Large ribosomal subunit protein bL32m n=1 Tax=Phyllotreta striolata TaxID=444603 RepID=A0A9N9TPI0_PHYSR|nr:unnamed protein product [Phyllotreta striolata]
MSVSIASRINLAFRRFQQTLNVLLGHHPHPPDAYCLAGVGIERPPREAPFSIESLIGDGFLWAVPKSRRSLEKRLKRKFGHPDYIWKLLKPKTDLKTCTVCGDDHEAGVLCPTCYKKVIEETRAMQEQIQNELKLEPVDKEVVVLYEGEKNEKPEEYYEGKRIVEMAKPRPAWFSRNLLQETTQKNATTKEVKPTDLG